MFTVPSPAFMESDWPLLSCVVSLLCKTEAWPVRTSTLLPSSKLLMRKEPLPLASTVKSPPVTLK